MMTVRELAEAAVVTPKTLTDLEHGRHIPNYATMRRVSQALGVEATEITEFAAAIEARAVKRNAKNAN